MRTLWIVAVWLMGVEGNLFQFGNMINHMVGKHAVWSYLSYGCYCGWGGQGKPQDATDRCCFVHDCCYGRANGCDPKLSTYSYNFQNGNIVCGNKYGCLRHICECDRVAAICFQKNMNTYNKKYKNYSSSNCQENSDKC